MIEIWGGGKPASMPYRYRYWYGAGSLCVPGIILAAKGLLILL